MSYIGRQPTIGNFVVLDAITTSATTTFALKLGGVAYYPATANNCIVSLNGIIQAPISSFTISGSNIVFSSALTSTDVIDFIQVLGDVLNIGTPSDNTVSLAKLTATGTKDSTTFLRGDNTFAVPSLTNTPSFFAYKSSDQTISDSTTTKITLTSEVYDTDSAYDTTNSKFTVPSGKAGKYFFTYGGLTGNFASGNWCEVSISVNGTEISPSRNRSFISTSQSAVLQGSIIYDLAVGDYVEMNTLQSSGGSKTFYGTVGTYFTHFQGFKLL